MLCLFAAKGNQYAATHGLTSLKRAFSRLGKRAIDGRSRAAIALRKWRQEILEDLGGAEAVSAQHETILDLACRTRLLLHSIDACYSSRKHSSTKKERRSCLSSLTPATSRWSRQYVAMLGLERRHKVKSLHEILSQQDNDREPVNGNDKAHEDKNHERPRPEARARDDHPLR